MEDDPKPKPLTWKQKPQKSIGIKEIPPFNHNLKYEDFIKTQEQ